MINNLLLGGSENEDVVKINNKSDNLFMEEVHYGL